MCGGNKMSVLTREELYPGIYLNQISDERFKTNRISVHLITPLSKETAAANALLPNLLRRGNEQHPDFTEFNQYLSELYGASVNYGVEKFGDAQLLTLSIVSIDDRYALESEPVTQQISTILFELLLKPVLKNGMFLADAVELEKQTLIDEIKSEINDKRIYAVRRTTALMCQNEPYGLNENGTVEEVERLTAEDVTKAYFHLLRSARIEIMFVGSGNASVCRNLAVQYFADLKRGSIDSCLPAVHIPSDQLIEQTDRMEVSQSKMVLGFSTGISTEKEREMYAMRLMVAVLGGTPMSKLFLNVREKLSLCYYCAARLDRVKGIIKIDSGIEHQNIEKAKEEILRQIDEIKAGNISDEEIKNAVMSLVNSYRTVGDSNAGISSYYLGQILCNTQDSPEQGAKIIQSITKEEIISAANHLNLEICYLLTQK
jgi:predicted Zn-dependent peptidase